MSDYYELVVLRATGANDYTSYNWKFLLHVGLS